MFKTNYSLVLRAMLAVAAGVISPVLASPERIVGGVLSEAGQFPYFVSTYCCGGALIAPDIVLTAAHCTNDFYCNIYETDVFISAIEYNATTGGAMRRRCVKWVNHTKHEFAPPAYDFALCKLDEPAEIDESLVKLELNEDNAFPPASSDLIAIGTGSILVNPPDPEFQNMWSFFLRNVTLPTISNTECTNLWEQTPIGYPIGESHICTMFAEGGKDTCFGDSGGPLVARTYQGDGMFKDTLVGIVSNGFGCALPNTPAVNSRVSGGMDWIKDTACGQLESVASWCPKKPKKSKKTKNTKKTKKTKKPKSK